MRRRRATNRRQWEMSRCRIPRKASRSCYMPSMRTLVNYHTRHKQTGLSYILYLSLFTYSLPIFFSLLVWYLSIFLAFQHYLTMIGAIVSIPFILTPALCMSDEDPNRGIIISTMIFVTGIVTYFQATWGVRLPIVQGGTISFLVPTLAILALPQWKCPPQAELDAMNEEAREELWQIRMRELSGAIAVSAMVQVVLGYTGLVGKILKYVTPLTIVPTVSLVGLTLFEHAADTASKHWGIAVG